MDFNHNRTPNIVFDQKYINNMSISYIYIYEYRITPAHKLRFMTKSMALSN